MIQICRAFPPSACPQSTLHNGRALRFIRLWALSGRAQQSLCPRTPYSGVAAWSQDGRGPRALSAQFLMTTVLKKRRQFGPLISEHQHVSRSTVAKHTDMEDMPPPRAPGPRSRPRSSAARGPDAPGSLFFLVRARQSMKLGAIRPGTQALYMFLPDTHHARSNGRRQCAPILRRGVDVD